LLRAEKRRSSASNVDRIKRIESVVVHLHLFEEGIKKIRDSRDGRRRIEIAIKAFAKTKRNVNVEAGSL
jgi:hypothetical protein